MVVLRSDDNYLEIRRVVLAQIAWEVFRELLRIVMRREDDGDGRKHRDSRTSDSFLSFVCSLRCVFSISLGRCCPVF